MVYEYTQSGEGEHWPGCGREGQSCRGTGLAQQSTKVERLIKQANWTRMAIRACIPHERPSKNKQKRSPTPRLTRHHLLHLECTMIALTLIQPTNGILKRELRFKDTGHLSRSHTSPVAWCMAPSAQLCLPPVMHNY